MQTVAAKTIVTRNKSTAWFGCEYNMNIYRGCCHGCLYCDSRSNCYHIENFDTVRKKENALTLIRNNLARRTKTGVIATGAMSDPYNPFEKQELLTRHALELIEAFHYGVAIATKSDLITRDIDVLSGISAQAPVLCKITVTTPDNALAAKLEPHAPAPDKRFAALEALSARNLFSGVLLMPVLPFLQDDDKNILTIVKNSANSGARFIYPAFGVTMRAGQREYFLQHLQQAFPGEDLPRRYRNAFGARYYCGSPRAKHLWEIFTAACQKRGLLYKMDDIVRTYRQGYGNNQLSFL